MTPAEIARQIVDWGFRILNGEEQPRFFSMREETEQRITAALDQERQRGEKYKKALEFYADVNNWRFDSGTLRIISNDDLEEMIPARFPSHHAGSVAREALKEVE